MTAELRAWAWVGVWVGVWVRISFAEEAKTLPENGARNVDIGNPGRHYAPYLSVGLGDSSRPGAKDNQRVIFTWSKLGDDCVQLHWDVSVLYLQLGGGHSMDVFAERRLVLTVAGDTIDVVAKLGRPVPDEALGSWKCPYEIWFGDNCYSHAMHGGDSLQALQLSMSTLDMELWRGAKRRGGELYFLDEPFGSVLDDSGMQAKPKTGATP